MAKPSKRTSVLIGVSMICSSCHKKREKESHKKIPLVPRSSQKCKCTHCGKVKQCREIDISAIIARAAEDIAARPKVMPGNMFTKHCSHCGKDVVPQHSRGGIIVELCPHCGHEIKPQVFRGVSRDMARQTRRLT